MDSPHQPRPSPARCEARTMSGWSDSRSAVTSTLTKADFEDWLGRYGAAWESRDPKAAARLFAEDAEYYWTPFGEPKRGPGGIAGAWAEATSRQRDVRFSFRILAMSGGIGIATWHTRLVRASTGREVEIDGILAAEFDDSGRCRVFREWWHSNEAESTQPERA